MKKIIAVAALSLMISSMFSCGNKTKQCSENTDSDSVSVIDSIAVCDSTITDSL